MIEQVIEQASPQRAINYRRIIMLGGFLLLACVFVGYITGRGTKLRTDKLIFLDDERIAAADALLRPVRADRV